MSTFAFEQIRSSQTNIMYFFKTYDLSGYTDPETGLSATSLDWTDYHALKVIRGCCKTGMRLVFLLIKKVYIILLLILTGRHIMKVRVINL